MVKLKFTHSFTQHNDNLLDEEKQSNHSSPREFEE